MLLRDFPKYAPQAVFSIQRVTWWNGERWVSRELTTMTISFAEERAKDPPLRDEAQTKMFGSY